MVLLHQRSAILLFVGICALFRSSASQSTKNYDSYALALEWQGTVCKFKNCGQDYTAAGTWNLHGLWPDADNGQHPFFCTNAPLNWDNLSDDLKKQLSLYWSGLYSSQQQFLDHEWTKHGTCWRTDYGTISMMPNQLQQLLTTIRTHSQNSADFLNFVVTLSKQVYRVYDLLSQNGISPSTTATYTFD